MKVVNSDSDTDTDTETDSETEADSKIDTDYSINPKNCRITKMNLEEVVQFMPIFVKRFWKIYYRKENINRPIKAKCKLNS